MKSKIRKNIFRKKNVKATTYKKVQKQKQPVSYRFVVEMHKIPTKNERHR